MISALRNLLAMLRLAANHKAMRVVHASVLPSNIVESVESAKIGGGGEIPSAGGLAEGVGAP